MDYLNTTEWKLKDLLKATPRFIQNFFNCFKRFHHKFATILLPLDNFQKIQDSCKRTSRLPKDNFKVPTYLPTEPGTTQPQLNHLWTPEREAGC